MKKLAIYLMMICFILLSKHQVYSRENPEIPLMSESALLMETKSGTILYEKNAREKMYPASITKIATAIYAIDTGNLSDIVTVSDHVKDVIGTKVYLEPGEKVTLEKLIIGLMINSGNDAGVAIAEHLHGSVENFANYLNRYLEEKIGVEHTHFTNPHGLFDPDHYTTAYDMAKITQYALKNEKFKQIFGMKEYKWDGESWDTTLLTHHRLLNGEYPYNGITGGKNGFVNESGFTLVTSAKQNDMELIAVTMKTNYKNAPYTDTIKLLDFGFNNFTVQMIPKYSEYHWDEKKFQLMNDVYYVQPNGTKIKTEVSPSGKLYVKTEEGEILQEAPLQLIHETKKPYNLKNEKTMLHHRDSIDHDLFLSIIVFIVLFAIGSLSLYRVRKVK